MIGGFQIHTDKNLFIPDGLVMIETTHCDNEIQPKITVIEVEHTGIDIDTVLAPIEKQHI